MQDNPSRGNQAAAVQAREAAITGKPQRIEASDSSELLELAREKTAKLRMAVAGDSSPVQDEDIPEMLRALMCHPDLYERFSSVNIELMARGALPHRDRELAILRVGWLCQAPYEWGEHVRIAKMVGISTEEVEAVTIGSSAECWNEHETALLRAAEELHEGAMVSEETWAALSGTYDDKQLFELMVLVGQFTSVAYFQNALRFRLSEGNEGLKAR